MKLRARRARQQQAADLNVTTFMNLMVVLVPFLLIMAVFSRMTVHELNLPSPSDAVEEQPPALQLEIILRADRLVVADRRRGALREIPVTADGYDLDALSESLMDLKRQVPDVDRATILLEPDVNYQDLIWVMDVVRGAQPTAQPGMAGPELFPQISIGDAPVRGGTTR